VCFFWFFFCCFLFFSVEAKQQSKKVIALKREKLVFEMIKLDTKRYLVIKFFFLGRVLGRSRSTFVNMLLQSVFFFFHPFTKGSFRRSDTHVIYINLHMHLRTICLIGIVVIFKVFF